MLDVVVVTAEDWQLWRELRRTVLLEAPGAFGSTLAEWSAEGDAEARWRARLRDVALNLVLVLDGVPAQERVVGAVDVRTVVLLVHVAGGAVALLCAAVVMAAGSRQDWSTGWGTGYVGCVAVTAVSALALTGPGATLPAAVRVVLLAVAVVTAAAAARGLQLAHRPPAGRGSARPVQLRLLWGSVTSLVAAIAVVSLPVVVWVLVIIAGTLLTERGYRRARLDPAWA